MSSPAAYGSWPSPIMAASLVDGAVGIAELVVDGNDIYWSEARPSEGGRVAIMAKTAAGETTEISPPGVNVRTRVHEYGGGAWWVCLGQLFYVDFADQRLRVLRAGEEPVVLTPEPETPAGFRYADGRLSVDEQWFVCVREHHHTSGIEPSNEIVAVATDGSQEVRVLVSGADFYAAPRPSPDGELLAWVQWNHPDMPWDTSTLWVGELDDGAIVRGRSVAGGAEIAVSQPQWSASSDLYFLTDQSGRQNLHRVTEDGDEVEVGGDFDIGGPHWVFGMSHYALTPNGQVVASMVRPNGDMLLIDSTDEVHSGWTTISAVRITNDGDPVFIGASQALEPAPIRYRGADEFVRVPDPHGVGPGFLAPPEAIEFPTTNGATAHGLFYAPANPGYSGADGELPPLMVLAHGGPTAGARRMLQLGLRYWTSRGWAVVDVDYRGSWGYGREYMRALDGVWGVADVDDCIAAAQHLAGQGLVDPNRMAIKGGSAGGFTVLAALAFHDVFAAGSSRYGVGDLKVLAEDTHKFESRYLDRLIGPYPEAAALYDERSPINHTDNLRCPMIVLQGGKDEVVPPNQAEMMVEALAAKEIPHAYLYFEDEGHGFRSAENIVAALVGEYSFFAQIFGFEPAGDLPKIPLR